MKPEDKIVLYLLLCETTINDRRISTHEGIEAIGEKVA